MAAFFGVLAPFFAFVYYHMLLVWPREMREELAAPRLWSFYFVPFMVIVPVVWPAVVVFLAGVSLFASTCAYIVACDTWWPALRRRSVVLALTQGSSDKFYEVRVRGASVVSRYGRRGTQGATHTVEFESLAAAQRHFEQLCAQKRRKGYQDGDDGLRQ
jgi:predicted DNA-binding WGR domain protein